MNLLVKLGLLGLLAGVTATAVYGDPPGGWLSPNGVGGGTSSTTATASASASASVPGVPGSVSGSASVGIGASVTLSLADVQARVHLLHEQTRADARHIQHLQQIARKEKDVIKLNCVNDKLVQVKPQMNIADLGESELEAAHDGERTAIFEGIVQSAETVRRLREEADQCIGEPTSSGGETSNSFTGPPAADDPTKGFGGDQIEPPGYASPFD